VSTGRRAGTGWRWLLAAAATSLAVTLLAVELVLRIFLVAPRLVASNYPLGAGIAGSELRLAQSEYDIRLRYNQFGFRGPEFPLEEQPDELRILVLGDSFAEGVGVAEESRFADLLDRDLAARTGRAVTVIDAGQMATGPASYVRNLTEFGVALRPDLVIMTIYIGNDFSVADSAAGAELHVNDTLPSRALADPSTWTSVLTLTYVRRGIEQLVSGEQLLFRRPPRESPWEVGYGKPVSRQYYVDAVGLLGVEPEAVDAATATMDPALVGEFFAGRINPSFFIGAIAEKASELKAAPARKPPRDVAAVIVPVAKMVERVNRLLASRGVAFLVLVVPDVHEMEPAAHDAFLARLAIRPSPEMERTGEVRQAFVRELEARSIPTLDLAPALRSAGARTFHIMDGHFNEAGHRVAAQALVERLAGGF